MPIEISEIPSLSLKEAMDRVAQGDDVQVVSYDDLINEMQRLSREAFALQNPDANSHLTSAPGSVNDLKEVQIVPVITGGNGYLYTKIAGALYYVQLTAV